LSTGEQVEIIQESTIGNIIQSGTQIKLTVNEEKVNVFLQDGSANILTGVNNQTFEE
jgi:iron(III) transport system ATP-binding protein